MSVRTQANPAIWALRHRKIRGQSFSFNEHEYLWQIYADKHPFKVIQKSAQCGISEFFINESFWLADTGRGNCLFVFPADPQLVDFSAGRVRPAIEESEYLSSRVTGVDNVHVRQVGPRFVYYRGSGTVGGGKAIRKLKSVDADTYYLDELDEMSPRVMTLADKRLGHSNLAWKRATSTPTVPEFGINELYLKSDQCQWHIKCEHCTEWQYLSFFKNVNQDSGTFMCRKCGKPINRLAKGEWVPKYPDRNIRGYHINKLFCGTTNIDDLIDASKKTASHEVQEFYNSDLGEPHVPEGGQLSQDILDACRDDYTFPGRGRNCTMGVDVGTYLHVRISEVLEDGIKRALLVTKVRTFDELDAFMKRYDVTAAVIDALPEQRKSAEFCERFKGRAYRCFYTENSESKTEWSKVNQEESKVTVLRTVACDYMLDGFIGRNNRLPTNAREIDTDKKGVSDYYAQMCAPVRVVEMNAYGQPVARYVHGSKPDHYFHAEVYDEIARRVVLESKPVIGVVFAAVGG